MNYICSLLLLHITLSCIHAEAGTQRVQVDVGGQAIVIPAPSGFHEISELSPETRKIAETMTPPTNRLLAIFVSENALGRIMKGESPELGRFMLLQVNREDENSSFSQSQFQKFAKYLKEKQQKNFLLSEDKVRSLVEGATKKLELYLKGVSEVS